jgi:hypothetical protein
MLTTKPKTMIIHPTPVQVAVMTAISVTSSRKWYATVVDTCDFVTYANCTMQTGAPRAIGTGTATSPQPQPMTDDESAVICNRHRN